VITITYKNDASGFTSAAQIPANLQSLLMAAFQNNEQALADALLAKTNQNMHDLVYSVTPPDLQAAIAAQAAATAAIDQVVQNYYLKKV
jgi:hypothetical protein